MKNSEYTCGVYPVDGTTNFAHGIPIFEVSIGLQKNNRTIIGIVFDVMRNKMYSSEKEVVHIKMRKGFRLSKIMS